MKGSKKNGMKQKEICKMVPLCNLIILISYLRNYFEVFCKNSVNCNIYCIIYTKYYFNIDSCSHAEYLRFFFIFLVNLKDINFKFRLFNEIYE